jgi:enoyl-CoA hydratase/carnithine racemase
MPIEYRKEGKIAFFTIDRPQVLNALSLDALNEFTEDMKDFRDDPQLCVGIVTGAGEKAFCTGMDLRSTLGLPTESLFGEGTFVRGFKLWKPLIAAVNGYAFGGGLEIALACDIRIASQNAVFGLTEVTLGLIPGWGGTQRLPRLISFGKAAEMILMGKRISADEAYRLNLANKVVPLQDLMPKARQMAGEIAELDALAVQSAKEAMIRGSSMTLADGLRVESDLLLKLAAFRDVEVSRKGNDQHGGDNG